MLCKGNAVRILMSIVGKSRAPHIRIILEYLSSVRSRLSTVIMYYKLHPILKNNILRNHGTCFRAIQHNIQRNKSYLISPHCFNYKEFVNRLPKLMCKISTDNFVQTTVEEKVKKVAEYGSHEGNSFRGSLAVVAYETIELHHNITEKKSYQIRTLACCVEILSSYFMILDDLESQGTTHWGNYDPSLLRSFIYEILRLEFMDKPSYVDIVHLFDKTFLNTTVGHHMDIIHRKDFKNFTKETYNTIADLKTSFHTFQLPILLAMKLMKNVDESLCRSIQATCLELGRLYQMQTDYLDCYGEETDQFGIPKHSSDIQQGRCSWLAVTALQRCTAAQRNVFSACYGSRQPAHIERVKLLYDQLQIPEIYKEETQRMCESIVRDGCGNIIDNKLLLKVLDVIKDRDNQ